MWQTKFVWDMMWSNLVVRYKGFRKIWCIYPDSCMCKHEGRRNYLPFKMAPARFEVNPLTPNDDYSGRTAPLTSKRCILYIYSTNIGTEYFKHGITLRFFLFKMQFVS